MKLTEKIKNKIDMQKTKNKKLDKKVSEQANEIEKLYIEKKENGEENPINDTVGKIIEIVQNNPDQVEVRKLIKELIERKNISDQIVERTVIELSKKEEVQNRIIIEAIGEAEASIPDSSIKNIINKGDMDIQDNLELIQQMQDQEKQEQAKQEQLEIKNQEEQKRIEQQMKKVKTELEKIYAEVTEIKDTELVSQIEDINRNFKLENINSEIDELTKNIIVQRIAEDYYDDRKRMPAIYTLSQIIPTGKMIELDIPVLVQKKYEEIEEERGTKEGRYNKKDFKKLVLNEMGRQIGIEYKITKVFNIPVSKRLSQMTKEEKKYLIDAIQKHIDTSLKKEEIIDISRQINEENKELQKKENQIINLIKQTPTEEKSRIIDILNKIIADSNRLETLEMLDNTGLLNKLENLPKEKREKTIGIINSAVEKNKYKVAVKTPKVNSAKLSVKPTIEDEER